MSVSNIINPSIGKIDPKFIPIFPYYASFTRNTSKVVDGLNTPTSIEYDTTEISNGIIYDPLNPSHLIVPHNGVYKVSYSIQLDKSGGGVSHCDMWLKLNGSDIPRSASQATVQGNDGETFVMCEYILRLLTTDILEVYFLSVDDATMAITAFPATGRVPIVPAIILNMYSLELT